MARCALRERSDGTQACIPRSEQRRREPGVLAAHLERLAPVRHVPNAGLPQQVQRTALATWVQSVQPSAHSACRLAASQREQESRDPLKMITARARFLGGRSRKRQDCDETPLSADGSTTVRGTGGGKRTGALWRRRSPVLASVHRAPRASLVSLFSVLRGPVRPLGVRGSCCDFPRLRPPAGI